MSSHFEHEKELEEIPSGKSLFESKRNREGDRCLFFKTEEVDTLFGHEVKFYPNGALLVLREDAKDYSKNKDPMLKIESKSFIFYNNEKVENIQDKEPVLRIHNRNKNKETGEFEPPIKDIEVKIFEHSILVEETIGDLKNIYAIDVLTGDKTSFVTDDEQLSYDI